MPTTSFSVEDPTKVTLGGRWNSDGTKLSSIGSDSEIRFQFTGTDLQINYSAGGTAAVDVSIDGGAYTAFVSTNTTSKTLSGSPGNHITNAIGLADTVHTAIIRINSSYAGGGFRIWCNDGIVVTGASPSISQFPNMDTSGTQHIMSRDSRIQWNYADSTTSTGSYSAPSMLLTGANSAINGRLLFKTDGAKLWIWSRSGVGRLYIDGFAEQEQVISFTAGTGTPTYGWSSWDLPNDGQFHECMMVTKYAIDQINVFGGTAIQQSAYAAGASQCAVAFVGDSVMAGDSAVPYTNHTASLDTIAESSLLNRFTAFNRGTSGESVTSWNSGGKTRSSLVNVSPDIIVCFLGVNDLSGLTTTGARDAKRDEYIVMYTEMLRRCPKAKLYQFQINPDHSSSTLTQYNNLLQAQQDAINSVAASFPSRIVQFIAADPSWTYGPGKPTTGYTRDGAHPLPSGNCYAQGNNHASIVLSANPSGGDSITMTIGGTSYTFTFDAGSHGASSNPVVIGATVGDTITNLKNVMKSVLGRPNLVAWTNDSQALYFIGVRNCTSISKNGTNVHVYRNTSGLQDMLNLILPAAPSSGSRKRRTLLGML